MSVHTAVNLHVEGVDGFRFDSFDRFVSVKLEQHGNGVNVFVSKPEHARFIADLFVKAAEAMEAKLVASAEVK